MSGTNGTPIAASQIQDLREQTGAGIMECKKALQEANGNLEKAKAWLRDRGVALAAKKAGRTAQKGLIASYIHGGGSVGVLVELSCETDFVARTEDFQNLSREIAMQIAAMRPRWVSRDQVQAEAVAEKRKEFEHDALKENKPAAVAAKIAEGKLDKYLADFCLLEQGYIREPSGKVKVKDLLTEAVAKLGENIVIRRFVRYEIGGE
ncbi:MAG: translation elongation factor Ts [Elusimicrobiota bacterium]|jgi:elongation factor Ts